VPDVDLCGAYIAQWCIEVGVSHILSPPNDTCRLEIGAVVQVCIHMNMHVATLTKAVPASRASRLAIQCCFFHSV
jgi:hypothetical protein